MSEIISMSLDEQTLEDLDLLQKELGFSGRSETIRQCIRLFSNDRKQSKQMKGELNGVILVVHPDDHTEAISKIRHSFQPIIKTQIHNHLDNHACFELFVVKGPADTVRKMTGTLQTSKKVNLVKLIVV